MSNSLTWDKPTNGYGAVGRMMQYDSSYGTYRWGAWAESIAYATGFNGLASHADKATVMRATLSLTNGDKLKSLTFRLNVRRASSNFRPPYNLKCYMYTSDPTWWTPPESEYPRMNPPSGYIASTIYEVQSFPYNTYVPFTFSNLNLSANTKLYFLFLSDGGPFDWDCANYRNEEIAEAITGTFESYTLSVSPASVATGSNVSIAIGNGSGSSITARIKYGSTQLWSGTTTTGSFSVPVNKNWFTTAGVTTAKSMALTVTIDQNPTMSASFTATAGTDMNPTVGALSFTPVNSGRVATNFPNSYIAGYSKVKVTAAVTAGSNAAISSVVLSFPGGTNVTMSYNSTSQKYEGTTAAVINGNITFTVTATDARSLSGNNQGALSGVVAYVPPSISPDMDHCYRCDSSGNQQNGGLYATVKATATWYTALSGNALTQFLFYIKEDHTGGYSDTQNLTSGQQSAPLQMHVPGANDYATVVIAIQDKVSDVVTVEIRLPSALRNIYVRRSVDGTYLGVGMAPQRRSGKSTVELPDGGAVLIGGVPLQSVTNFSDDAYDGSQFGKNFLAVSLDNPYDVKNTEVKFYQRSAEAGWTNSPLGTSALLGVRRVMILGPTWYAVTIQEFYPVAGRLWTNFYNYNAWTGWYYTDVRKGEET